MQLQDLFISGREGYHTFRIPALAVAPDGTVLAFCEARRHTGRDDDQIDILLRRSSDGGRTWGPRQLVVSDGDRTCGNPCPVVDRASGEVLLPFCKDNQEVFVTRSGDGGVTWSDPVEITGQVKAPSWKYLGTGPGHGIQLQSGRLLVPSWVDESPGPATWRNPPPGWGKVQSSIVFLSDDGGRSWRPGSKLTHDASDECEAVETAGGPVYMTLRSRGDRRCRGWSRSADGGETWSEVAFDPALPEPSCQGSVVALEDGPLLLAHPRQAGRARRADPAAEPGPGAQLARVEGARARWRRLFRSGGRFGGTGSVPVRGQAVRPATCPLRSFLDREEFLSVWLQQRIGNRFEGLLVRPGDHGRKIVVLLRHFYLYERIR